MHMKGTMTKFKIVSVIIVDNKGKIENLISFPNTKKGMQEAIDYFYDLVYMDVHEPDMAYMVAQIKNMKYDFGIGDGSYIIIRESEI